MTDLGEKAALVALLRGARRPWHMYSELVEQAGSAAAVLEAEAGGEPAPASFGDGPLRAATPSPTRQPQLFADAFADADADPVPVATPSRPRLDEIAAEITAWNAAGIAVHTVLDPGYPDNLRAVHDRPPLIFVAGTLSAHHAKSIAVVGARQASAAGVAAATEIAQHLVDAGYTVVSGLAAGIDTAAHTAALARGGRTVAVIGTGLPRAYPPENAALQGRIAAEHAVLSQFWPNAPPSKRSFPMRNAVMSGFSLATVVVEAAETSGSRIQARLALEQGRPVFLWHSLLSHEWARAFAGRPGTQVVRSAAEITTAVERLTSPGTLVA